MNYTKYKIIFSIFTFLLLFSCSAQKKVNSEKLPNLQSEFVDVLGEGVQKKTYSGWWIYGENQHVFKDEESLEEWGLEFPNEDMEELKELYLAICEMEYFPMECEMTGSKKLNDLEKQTTLIVQKFNILYIEGCGE
tara:strand:- start:1088 stop:1495 length:408 start_codon:yes stop_codon:yes gene_type:complete